MAERKTRPSTSKPAGAGRRTPVAAAASAPASARVAGVQSVDTGLKLLSALIALGPNTMLKTLSEHAGIPPPQAHRYLASFCRGGLVARDPESGRYALGPMALDMGIAALRQMDVGAAATPALQMLRDTLNCTACLALWGTKGPTFVQVVETTADIIISVRPGSVLPLMRSATGRVFGAFLPAAQVEPLLDAELRAITAGSATGTKGRPGKASAAGRERAQALFAQVREAGVATVCGDLNAGIQGIAVPVFDYAGALAGTITAMGAIGSFDLDPRGAAARELLRVADALSHRLGRRDPTPGGQR